MFRSVAVMAFMIFFGFAIMAQAQEIIEGEPTGITSVNDQSPKKTIVLFYADWCPYCNTLKPRLYEIVNRMKKRDRDVLKIIQFDFSNDLTQVESAGLAGEHGLSDLYNEYAPGTGFAILVDDSVEIFEQIRLTANDTTDEMKTKIKNYINSEE